MPPSGTVTTARYVPFVLLATVAGAFVMTSPSGQTTRTKIPLALYGPPPGRVIVHVRGKRVPTAAPSGTLLVRVALTPGLAAAQGETTSTLATRPAKPTTAERIIRSKGTPDVALALRTAYAVTTAQKSMGPCTRKTSPPSATAGPYDIGRAPARLIVAAPVRLEQPLLRRTNQQTRSCFVGRDTARPRGPPIAAPRGRRRR
jgi:hypothetical protein